MAAATTMCVMMHVAKHGGGYGIRIHSAFAKVSVWAGQGHGADGVPEGARQTMDRGWCWDEEFEADIAMRRIAAEQNESIRFIIGGEP